MVFGQSYSVQYVKPLQWVHTSWVKKFARTLLGCLVSVGLYVLFWGSIRTSSIQSTRYFFGFAAPALLISFFMFGLFPIACKYMGLVSKVTPNLNSSNTAARMRMR